jgi:hypothetical protein
MSEEEEEMENYDDSYDIALVVQDESLVENYPESGYYDYSWDVDKTE